MPTEVQAGAQPPPKVPFSELPMEVQEYYADQERARREALTKISDSREAAVASSNVPYQHRWLTWNSGSLYDSKPEERGYLGARTSDEILELGRPAITLIFQLYLLYETIPVSFKPSEGPQVFRVHHAPDEAVRAGVELPWNWGFDTQARTGVIDQAYFEHAGIQFHAFDNTIQSLAREYFKLINAADNADADISHLWGKWESYTANKAESFFKRNFDPDQKTPGHETPIVQVLVEFNRSIHALTNGLQYITEAVRSKADFTLGLLPKFIKLLDGKLPDDWKRLIQIGHPDSHPSQISNQDMTWMSQKWNLIEQYDPADIGLMGFSNPNGTEMYPLLAKQEAKDLAHQKMVQFETGFRDIIFRLREKCTATRAEIQEQLHTMAAELLETEPAKFEYLD